ncbi:retrovirus-related Pol polyprotein from transposon 412 [Trichonephila clavipes]|nr:retrovirus-related Pol polyprotein from transposon 412 [Trichonephila clavipes]
MPRTRRSYPLLTQTAFEKFNLTDLIPKYDGSESLGIRRVLEKISDAANLGNWSNAEKITILKLKLAGIAEDFFYPIQLTGSSESVQEFAERINKLGTQIFQSSNATQNTAARNANDQLLQSRFISGLRNDIRRFVLARDPNNLEESVNAALIEEQNAKLNQIANDERTGLSHLHTETLDILALTNKLDEINLRVERLQESSSVTARKTDRHKTAFSTPDGDKYEFNRLCFGLKNSPKAFQSIVQEVLGDLFHNGALVYIDDVILFTKTIAEHFELLEDTPFEWTSETQEAFDDIKEAILNPPVLALPDPNAELQITTVASSRGIGAVLEQKYPNSEVKPLHFFSKELNPSQSKYNATVLEFFAIYTALNFFRPFLLGRKFKVFTDHKPLAGFLSNKNPSSKILRGKMALEEFNFDIH